MKRFFAIAVIAVMIAALLCACGNNNSGTSSAPAADNSVTTTVASKYDDGYASKYADSAETDANGNTVYTFSDAQYNDFVENYKNSVSNDIQKDMVANHEEGYGEYVYINTDKQAVIVGIHEDEYDEAAAQTEAAAAAEYGFKYFQNLKTPVNTIKVIYCNAGNQDEEYGSFEFTAD